MPLRVNTTIATIVNTADRLGALPKPVRKDWDRLVGLQDKVRNFDLPAYSLPRAALAVLEADGDLLNDTDIQRAVISRALGDLRAGLTSELDGQMADFIDTHGAAILDTLAKPFDAAAETIQQCLTKLGDVALDDTAAAIRKGGDAAQTWSDGQIADQTINDIATAVKLMRRNAVDRRYQLLIIADVPPAKFLDDQLAGSKLRPWDAARRGYQLSLANLETLDQRIEAIAVEMQRRETHARGAFEREYKRTHGFAVKVKP